MKNLTPEGRQKGLAVCLGSILVLLLGGVFWMMDEEEFLGPSEGAGHKTSLTTAQDCVNPQALWVARMETENKVTQQKIDALEKTLKAFMKETASQNVDPQVSLPLYEAPSPEGGENVLPPLDFDALPAQTTRQSPETPPEGGGSLTAGIRKVVLTLKPATPSESSSQTPDTVENTLPANAYATAVILGGVDASTSIQAASNPRPVLLRILDKGNLPRRFKSDLKNCRVSASAYGDISSERVYMRLEKLTCLERLTGESVQTQVAGYVLGEDGRAGVRGVVADRAGELIRQTLMGGFLSGMSQFFGAQQQRSVFPVSPFGQTNALSKQQMLESSLSQGASGALEKYADFFIKRAEQLQPVLQVAAGRKVDIVFTEGTRLGDTSVRKAIERVRRESRAQAVQQFEHNGAGSPAWLPPVHGETR